MRKFSTVRSRIPAGRAWRCIPPCAGLLWAVPRRATDCELECGAVSLMRAVHSHGRAGRGDDALSTRRARGEAVSRLRTRDRWTAQGGRVCLPAGRCSSPRGSQRASDEEGRAWGTTNTPEAEASEDPDLSRVRNSAFLAWLLDGSLAAPQRWDSR